MPKQFDFHTEKRNKAGQVVQSNPYVMHIIDGETYFEQPPQSGEFYHADGSKAKSEQIPGKLQPKLRVSEKDQAVEVGPKQTLAEMADEGGKVEVKQVEEKDAGVKPVLPVDKKVEDKRK